MIVKVNVAIHTIDTSISEVKCIKTFTEPIYTEMKIQYMVGLFIFY
jgi:hypothetical protein